MLSKIDLNDFMANDDNLQLRRLSDKLMNAPEFQSVVETWGNEWLDALKNAIDYCASESRK